jgi:nicotinate phosphoribosyltransferase
MTDDGQGAAGSTPAAGSRPFPAAGEIRGLADLRRFRPAPTGRLQAATHEEIRSGATTDVYFVKTMDILASLGRADTPVVAEVFSQRPGVCCGTDEVLDLLRQRPVRIEALDEGEEFAAREVILRLSGPYGAFCIFETALLGMLASASAWATAARAVKRAAGDHLVTCFGSRHLHPAVAPVMERAALVGGVDAVSSVLAARLTGREPTGTLPHAVMLVVGDTVETARAYDRCMPAEERRTVLVDTFKDEGEEALRVAAALGERLAAIRLDTPGERGGVTPDLVREVRARLDQAGHNEVGILVSGGVTAERIPALVEAGATGFGVGSAISAAAPIDMTMDLKEVAGRPVAKRGRIPGTTPSSRLRVRQPGPAAGGRGISG